MGELRHRALAESLHLRQEFGGTGVLQSLAVFLLLPYDGIVQLLFVGVQWSSECLVSLRLLQ